MKSEALIYVPSDTPDAMVMASRKVAGVPLVVRGIMTLSQAGFERLTILIAASQRDKIERFLQRYREQRLPRIDIVSYDEPYRVSPSIVRRVAESAGERILLINANLLFEKDLVSAMRSLPLDRGEIMLCEEGAHRLPVIDASVSAWQSLEAFTSEMPRSIESCINRLIESAPSRTAAAPAGINTFLVRRQRERAVAEKFLAEAIRHSTPGPIAKYINKRISLPISLFLSKLWVSPNTITVFNILIGLFSGVFVADGHSYEVILLGAALFQIASIIDGCDGEVAKFTFRCSKFGQYIDTLSDNLSLGSFMAGLIAGYWRHTHSPVAFISGGVMLATTAITFFWMIRYLARNTQSASLATFDKVYISRLSGEPGWLLFFIKYGKYGFKKDVFSFMFLVSAVLGGLYWWLFIIAFGTSVAAIILTYLNLKAWRAAAPRRCANCAGLRQEELKA
ncbi:MAG: CDP-alcohol phosphatidyltransferase family protein [bacterium]